MTNLRLRDKFNTDGGAWFVPVETGISQYHRKTLSNYQVEEPEADWHLETRGTKVTWHRVK